MNMLAGRRMVLGALVAAHAPIKGKTLDVGCGDAPYKRLDFDAEWHTMDIRPVGDIQGDFHNIPFEDDCFDTVLCADSLQYAVDPPKVMLEMARVLKPGGTLIVLAPNCQQDDEVSLWGFRVAGLNSLARIAGLKVSNLFTASKQWEFEFTNLGSLPTVAGYHWPAEVQGWVGHLDEVYPAWSVLVAVKE